MHKAGLTLNNLYDTIFMTHNHFSELLLKKRENLGSCETLLEELPLEDECNYKTYLRMTSENFEKIFQLIKDDIIKENAKMRELIPSRL